MTLFTLFVNPFPKLRIADKAKAHLPVKFNYDILPPLLIGCNEKWVYPHFLFFIADPPFNRYNPILLTSFLTFLLHDFLNKVSTE